jgi:hypothetical protein
MARTEIPNESFAAPGRRRLRGPVGVALVAVGLVAMLLCLPGVDVSAPRYFLFVAGAALVVAGLLVLSLRTAAVLAVVFAVAVAAEGPVRGDDAAAVRLLDRTVVPSSFRVTARGFQGNGRAFPYLVFAGSTGSIDPSMLRLPSGFSRVPLGFDFANELYGRPIQSGSASALRESGFAPIATWQGNESSGRICQIELDAADPGHVAAALAGAGEALRSEFEGKVIVRLLSFCSSRSLLENRRPGSNGGITPTSEETPLTRGGPR